jgi:hypothetical protein
MHAASLAKFEEALHCKADPALIPLLFMSACNSQNSGKAKQYYAKLAADQQTRYAPMCIRNHVEYKTDFDFQDDAAVLQIMSRPPAKVMIDGQDTGQLTPAKIKVTPGKHRVTYIVGDDRYTYPVTVEAGHTETLSKDLQ